MDFEQWINRPLYRAQVTTYRLYVEMLGLEQGKAYATPGNHPLALLRLLPAHRCEQSKALRKALADQVKTLRRINGRRNVIIKHIAA